MKQVKWEEFRLSPMRYASEKFKVVKGDGGYFLVEYHSPYVEDDAKEVKKERGENKGKDDAKEVKKERGENKGKQYLEGCMGGAI